MHKKTGFTLVEIIVATVILCLVILGMASLFIGGKRWVMHSRDRMTGIQMGKLFVDPLQSAVRQDTWADAGNALYVGTRTGTPISVNNVDYTPQYTVSDVTTSLRRVITKISWTEAAP